MKRLTLVSLLALAMSACASQFQQQLVHFNAADNAAATNIATNPYSPDPLMPQCLAWKLENVPQILAIFAAPVVGPDSLFAKHRAITRLFAPDSPQRVGGTKACGPVWYDTMRRFGPFLR